MSSALSNWIGRKAVEHTVNAMKGGEFDYAIERVVIQSIRTGPDDGLSRLGYILKMAIELMDRSCPPISFQQAQRLANDAYHQFRRDNNVRFGDAGWDWTGRGARIVAQEYVIAYWEPV